MKKTDDPKEQEESTSFVYKLENLLSTRKFRITSDFITIAFFIFVVIAPTVYIFFTVFTQWDLVYSVVFADPLLGDSTWGLIQIGILRSLEIASIVTLIDIAIGLPMALIMARYEFKGKKIIDTLIDIPLAVPTSALGFSLFLFWGTASGPFGLLGIQTGLVSRGPILIILTHVAFSYPYIVRSLRNIIETVPVQMENAARTLGASSFSVFRTITSPLIKEGLIAGAILAFTRSLGETGATLIVAGIYETAPLMIVSWQKALKIPATAFLAMVLVVISVCLLVVLRLVARRVGIPIEKIWPYPEKLLSHNNLKRLRDIVAFGLFIGLVFFPSLYLFQFLFTWWSGSPYNNQVEAGAFYQIFLAPDKKFESLISSLITSLQIAGLSTIINLVFGLPMAYILIRRNWGKLNSILDTLIDIPLIIPSSALGFSFFLFWGYDGLGLFTPGFALILITHVAFTYPYCVRPLMAVVSSLDKNLEQAAYTLGASPITTIRKVTIPLMGQGIMAASIMTFTRSLGETGATIVVMGLERTIPVLIVDWVESFVLPSAAFACVVLILLSYVLLLFLRYISEKSGVVIS
ncbi:MAG: ABC transporter permease [Candidatus Ranarchaeia archaeon]